MKNGLWDVRPDRESNSNLLVRSWYSSYYFFNHWTKNINCGVFFNPLVYKVMSSIVSSLWKIARFKAMILYFTKAGMQ